MTEIMMIVLMKMMITITITILLMIITLTNTNNNHTATNLIVVILIVMRSIMFGMTLGKDKGAPSKGGFLNDILFICTYHEFHYTDIDPYMKIIDYSGNHLY